MPPWYFRRLLSHDAGRLKRRFPTFERGRDDMDDERGIWSNGRRGTSSAMRAGSFRQVYARGRSEDLQFLAAWEQGRLALLAGIVRVRQINRALADR